MVFTWGWESMYVCVTLPKPIDAEGICKHLAGKVVEWTGGADRFDDTTILALSVDAYNSNAAAATATTATPVNSPKEAILKERLRSSL